MSKIVVDKSKSKIFLEYFRTVFVSFLVATFFTILLAFHARSEMIKNLYLSADEQNKLDRQIALKLVREADFTKDLKSKKYTICMQVGNIYEMAGNNQKAEFAYKLAIEKTSNLNYTPYFSLVRVLINQEKFNEAQILLNSIKDLKSVKLIKFKTKSYITIGDKYYSISKFLSAANAYEKAFYYYNRFEKKDVVVENSIKSRIVNSYINAADIMVKNNLSKDAVRFLKKAESFSPDNFEIKYKLAILYTDLDPQLALKYLEYLLKKQPQRIDYSVYNKALMRAANIADLEGKVALAKLYRYKIHSNDIFINNKVIYKNDIQVYVVDFIVRKMWFKYKLKANYRFKNISTNDIKKLNAEFVLRQNDKILETVTKTCATKARPLFSGGGYSDVIQVVFGKNIFTRKELEQYVIDIYLYKDDKYKTFVCSMKVPVKSIKNNIKYD